MEIQTGSGKNINIDLIITYGGKPIKLNKMSSNDLIDILEEVTNSFLELQWEIEATLDEKCPSGFMIRDGEKIDWSEAIRQMSLLIQ